MVDDVTAMLTHNLCVDLLRVATAMCR